VLPSWRIGLIILAKRMTERIVVIDDEEDIRELIEYNLSKEGYEVASAMSAEEAVPLIKSAPPDMIILDLMLPGINGLELCRQLKGSPEYKDIPIIMVTARSEESDIVRGLELGADDYVSKPFSPKVLNARVKSVLRRGRQDAADESSVLSCEKLTLDPQRRFVSVEGQAIELTNTEFKLLHFLLRRPGFVFTRDQIVEGVHGDDYPVTDRSVDVQVVGLRKKLHDYGSYIETVRGVGYRFKGYAQNM
jgi:two-component system alkaline phosphatase synthesis response regulator PhoP